MDDLHQVFDALAGYLLGMTLVEVVVKPTMIKIGKKALSSLDDRVDVVPDWLHSEPFDR
jgi:hypothetical protein